MKSSSGKLLSILYDSKGGRDRDKDECVYVCVCGAHAHWDINNYCSHHSQLFQLFTAEPGGNVS